MTQSDYLDLWEYICSDDNTGIHSRYAEQELLELAMAANEDWDDGKGLMASLSIQNLE